MSPAVRPPGPAPIIIIFCSYNYIISYYVLTKHAILKIVLINLYLMKILVTYLSKTGNTKKIAEAIYGEIDCEKEIKQIKEVYNIDSYDFIFVGSPIHAHGVNGQVKKFLISKCKGKKIAVFITHATPEEYSEEIKEATKEVAKEADLVGLFACQGELAFGIKTFMKLLIGTKLRKYAKGDNSQRQPDEERVEKARIFAREIMKKISS